ncbi:MAG: hypothetical protein L0I62_04095 [Gammaproteobacteria bacterium]|nr:hypothetical protein [Gammaproteobacteria bacterium]
MMWKCLLNFVPSLLVALGIIVATPVAKFAIGFGWWVMAGPALLALFVLAADLLQARLRGNRLVPLPDVLILATAVLAAGLIAASHDPGFVAALIPIFGVACCGPVVWRSGRNRRGSADL